LNSCRRWRWVLAILAVVAGPAAAQDATGTLVVTVRRQDSVPLPGAFVRSDRIGGVANDSGQARIQLPARLVSVIVSHPGYRSSIFEITIVPAVTQRYDLVLDPSTGRSSEAVIETTRAGRPLSAEPVPVSLLGRDKLTLGAVGHPTDLIRLLHGRSQARLQPQSGSVDGSRLRLNGVRGQYTGVLIDGLPLLGSQSGTFGLLQLSPLEFDQVEVIPGAATSIAGAGAAAGLINLLSRRPERDQARLGVNQSSEKGGDVVFWGSRRQSPTVSASVFADLHQQRLVDADDDGWGEFPRAIRVSVRPRLYLDRPNGDGLMVTMGVMSEDRTGGFLSTSTGADLYREERRDRRLDGAVIGRRGLGNGGTLQLKLSATTQSVRYAFEDVLERDRRSTLFSELTYRDQVGPVDLVAGVGYRRDALRQRDYPEFDFTHHIPSIFGTVTRALADQLVATVAGRCDYHNLHGSQCVPRLDVLYQPVPQLDIRAYGAAGYNPASPLADEAETLGLHAMIPVNTKAEKTQSAGVDLRWRRGRLTVAAAAAYTRVSLPIRAIAFAGDPAFRLRLVNVAEPTRVASAEVRVEYRNDPVIVEGFVGLTQATEGVPGGSTRRDADFTPRRSLGTSLQWQAPAGTGTTVSLDAIYVSSQTVTDNLFLTATKGYGIMNGVVSQRSGRARLYLSAENLLDVRLADYHPVFYAVPEAGGRRTPSPWAPLRGRVISLGALVDW